MTPAFDLLLCLALLLMAGLSVAGRNIIRSVVMFIAFGVLMALVWARLHAPDLALAEAAVGAGVTGALLLITLQRLGRISGRIPASEEPRRTWLALPVATLAAVLVGVVGWAAIAVPGGEVAAGRLALAALDDTAIENAVTGVLLVFRGYDTLLEMAVVLLAVLGARAVRDSEGPALVVTDHARQPLAGVLMAVVAPLTVVASAHLLLAGSYEPGGAFQAGVVLAAGAVLLLLTGSLQSRQGSGLVDRLVVVAGVTVFSALGLAMMLSGRAMLEMPGMWAVYLVETALLLSVAVSLTLLFANASGLRRGRRQ